MLHPFTIKLIKENSPNWFDKEVLEKLSSKNKLFKTFKRTRLAIDKVLYKIVKYDTLKLIEAQKKYSLMKNSQEVLTNLKR